MKSGDSEPVGEDLLFLTQYLTKQGKQDKTTFPPERKLAESEKDFDSEDESDAEDLADMEQDWTNERELDDKTNMQVLIDIDLIDLDSDITERPLSQIFEDLRDIFDLGISEQDQPSRYYPAPYYLL